MEIFLLFIKTNKQPIFAVQNKNCIYDLTNLILIKALEENCIYIICNLKKWKTQLKKGNHQTEGEHAQRKEKEVMGPDFGERHDVMKPKITILRQ